MTNAMAERQNKRKRKFRVGVKYALEEMYGEDKVEDKNKTNKTPIIIIMPRGEIEQSEKQKLSEHGNIIELEI